MQIFESNQFNWLKGLCSVYNSTATRFRSVLEKRFGNETKRDGLCQMKISDRNDFYVSVMKGIKPCVA